MLSTSVGFKSLNFDISNSNAKTNSVNVPTFKFDINSLFIKSIGTSLHILKPRFFYGYVGYEDQNKNPVFDTHNITMMNQLFNIDRFAGMDRIGDQNFYTLSLEYRKRELNMEKISFKISQKFYLEDKKIFLNDMNMLSMNMDMYLADDLMAINSMTHNMINDEDPIMLMGKWMPNKNIMIMTYGSYLKDDKKFPMAGITLNQKFKFGKVGYAKRYKKVAGDFEKTLDYSELSADLNFKNNFSLIAKLKRDDDTNSKIESVFGIGYENCCFVFRVTASDKNLSKYLDSFNDNSFTYLDEAWDNIIRIENKSRINFEFEFKGLNSSYEKVNKFMNNSILNY
jgi:LPS-assembly protein